MSGSLLLVTIPITSASPNLLFAPLPPVRAAIELGVAVAVETKVSNAPPPRNVWRTVPTTYLPLNCWPTPLTSSVTPALTSGLPGMWASAST